MKPSNLWIKNMLKSNDLTQYQLAREIGVSDYTLIRWLRYDLTEDRAIKVDKGLSSLLKKNKKEKQVADFTIDDIINTDPRLNKKSNEAIKDLIKIGMATSLNANQDIINTSKENFDKYMNPSFLAYNGNNLQDLLDEIDKVTEE